MNGGVKFLACTALLAIAACTGEDGKLEVRAIPRPIAPGAKPVPFRVAEGHQQFAMGNVALAMESYRKALRDDPNSIDALAGLAAGYDRMGRFDLAQRNYEMALAIEPGNTMVLALLAGSLDQQGKKAQAFAVREEVQRRMAAADAPAILEAVQVAVKAEQAQTASVTEQAHAQPTRAAADIQAEMPKPDYSSPTRLASNPIAIASKAIEAATVTAAYAPEEPVTAARAAAPVKLTQASAPARSVTITLPKAAPAAAIEKPLPEVPATPRDPSPAATQMAAIAPPAKTARPTAVRPLAPGTGPRLERTSLGEVALVMNGAPKWASLVVKQEQRSATVRFVPLKEASARFASVRLLNAARVQGLAARTRSTLLDRGWRNMAIGDANATRARSLVLYPAHRRATALTLARQFGFASAQRATGREITVLLGRDAVFVARRLPAA